MRRTAALVGPDARWEKAEDGYQLRGVWPPLPAKPLSPSGANWWLTGFSAAALPVIFALVWWLDRRARRAKASRGEP